MVARVVDNFNRADANPIGGIWSTAAVGGYGNLQINANTLIGVGSGDEFAYINSDSPPNAQYTQIKVRTQIAADDGGPVVRGNQLAGTGYLLDTDGSTLGIFRMEGTPGFAHVGIGTTFSYSAAANDVLRLMVDANANLVGSINGTNRVSATDSNFASGVAGIFTHASGTIYDDFESGDFTVVANITGTATAGITESDIVAGGKTVIATIDGDTYVPLSSTALIALRGSPKANNAANGGNVVLTWDTGGNAPQTGDWVIIFGGHGNAVTTLLPPGVNAVNDGTFTNIAAHTGSAPVVGAWKKKMGATPDLKATCSGAGNASDGVAYIGYVVQNVDPVTSEDASVTFNNSSSTNPNPNSITTVTDGALIIAAAASRVNDTTPGTVTNYVNQITSAGNGTNPMTVSALVKLKTTAGADDPAAFSSWSTGVWNAFTMAFRPRVDTPFNNSRQNFINGMDSAQAEAHGWDAEVKAKIAVTDVVRTNNTVVTVTLDAEAAYDITANETITVTVPADILVSNANVVGTPTFVVATAGGGTVTIKYTQLEHAVRGSFRSIILGARH
jgi:hypothetical protein